MSTAKQSKRVRAEVTLVDRVRALLSDRNPREVNMFGGLAFMVDGAIVVSAGRTGSLLVRVCNERDASALARPGATRAEMGSGRDMGVGWITVAPEALDDDAELRSWVELAVTDRQARRDR